MKSNNRLQKLLCIVVLFIILTIININVVEAAVIRPPQEITDKLNNYPGYKELIDKLKQAHPNWNFRILYTGLDWNQAIKAEASHGRNLVSSTKSGSWICSVCGDKKYDNGSWRCASEIAIAYYMDPRNSLNENYVFQFESLSFNEKTQTIQGVNEILKDVKYMQTDKVTYIKTDGTQGVINKTYAQIIMEAAKESNVSPYHLAARIRQEQGAGTEPSPTAKGKYAEYVGYYNFFNIRATGDGDDAIIRNALNYAKNNGLTDPEKSIKQGAKFLAKDYISSGQDTLYLQKFDVDDSDGSLYYFQFMQNLSASKSEGTEAREAYEELGMIDSSIDFIIPVFENMPETACAEPTPDKIVTQNVKVKGEQVRVRQGRSTSSAEIATVNTGDDLLRIEIANSTNEGYYWDKVVLPNGKKGYIARTYIVEVADIKNCNETSIVKSNTANLRNGPGLEGTTIITTLIKGQMVTKIEKGKYNNLDGYSWVRVVLADGRQGYVVESYLGKEDDKTTVDGEIVKVICKSGLKIRKAPGTNQIVSDYAEKGELLTRIQKSAANVDGYIWDKIVNSRGIEGYIARGDSKQDYIEVVSDGNNVDTQKPNNEEETPTSPNNEFKLENGELICEPNTTIEYVKEKYSDTKITVKKADGTNVETGYIGTGYVINMGDKTYTVIKMGDANGDGKITPADATVILRACVGLEQLSDVFQEAVNVNEDKKITPADATVILRACVGLETINL